MTQNVIGVKRPETAENLSNALQLIREEIAGCEAYADTECMGSPEYCGAAESAEALKWALELLMPHMPGWLI